MAENTNDAPFQNLVLSYGGDIGSWSTLTAADGGIDCGQLDEKQFNALYAGLFQNDAAFAEALAEICEALCLKNLTAMPTDAPDKWEVPFAWVTTGGVKALVAYSDSGWCEVAPAAGDATVGLVSLDQIRSLFWEVQFASSKSMNGPCGTGPMPAIGPYLELNAAGDAVVALYINGAAVTPAVGFEYCCPDGAVWALGDNGWAEGGATSDIQIVRQACNVPSVSSGRDEDSGGGISYTGDASQTAPDGACYVSVTSSSTSGSGTSVNTQIYAIAPGTVATAVGTGPTITFEPPATALGPEDCIALVDTFPPQGPHLSALYGTDNSDVYSSETATWLVCV